MADNNPDKYFEDQMDGEEVLFVFRKHPIVMRKGLIIGMAAWLVGPLYTFALTYIYANQPDKIPSVNFFFISLAASIMLGVILIIPSWISWYFSVFIVTDQRLIQITQRGLFNRTVVEHEPRPNSDGKLSSCGIAGNSAGIWYNIYADICR